MRSAPAVGYLVMSPAEDGTRQWGVKTERQIIPLKGTMGMITSVEALEYALREGWSFLYRWSDQLYVTRQVELLTITFLKNEDGWAAYPAYIASKEGMAFSLDTTPEQIASFCVERYWYPMEDDPLAFQKLGLPVSPSERSW